MNKIGRPKGSKDKSPQPRYGGYCIRLGNRLWIWGEIKMNPTHLTRTELYEEIKKLTEERDHYKKMTDNANKAFAQVLQDIHNAMQK